MNPSAAVASEQARALAEGNLMYRDPVLHDHFAGDVGTLAALLDLLLGDFKPSGAHTILDLGCGTGVHASALTSYEYVGIDLQPWLIAYAQAAYPHGRFAVGDITRYRSESAFDVLLSLGNTLAYLHTEEDLNAACATFAANAAPGALVVVHTLVSPPAPSHGQQVVSVPGGQATVTIDSAWDKKRRMAITNRAWAMPDGKEFTDTFERRVHGVGDLQTALTVAGLEVRDAFDHYDRRGEPVQGPTAYVIAQAPGVGDHR
ncbi:class I SAM-dependent methyltransferase [Nocardioides sp. NPDC051685]|uniref:class I SAM-dependent methyltransferase n=1 Tax=Nocardioides sp. NPDC051685 TaxID=3364334 RepID=UPI0037A3AD0A